MNIYNQIRIKVLDTIKKYVDDVDKNIFDSITCEQPKNINFGDLSTNALMILKRNIKNDKDKIEELIISDFEANDLFEKVTYVKPGFINFTLKKSL